MAHFRRSSAGAEADGIVVVRYLLGTVGFEETARFATQGDLVDVEPNELVISHSHYIHNHLERLAAAAEEEQEQQEEVVVDGEETKGSRRPRHRSLGVIAPPLAARWHSTMDGDHGACESTKERLVVIDDDMVRSGMFTPFDNVLSSIIAQQLTRGYSPHRAQADNDAARSIVR